jgi:hypothetical protein
VAQGLAEHGIGPAELEQVRQGGRAQAHELSQVERARQLDSDGFLDARDPDPEPAASATASSARVRDQLR